jgi:prokaryotic YEATS domain/TIR domain
MTIAIQQEAWPDSSIKHYWQWRVWLGGSEAELDEIGSVRYQLHPTFPQPTRIVRERETKFALSSSGWGEFTIYSAIKFKDPAREEHLLNHWLRLGGSAKEPEPIDTLKGAAPRVFVSSSFADVHLANELAEALRGNNVQVLDPNEVPLGVDWRESIASKISAADLAVIIVGDQTGEWLNLETKKLLSEGKDIIPVVLAERVPDLLDKYNAIRIKQGEPAQAIADRIVGIMPALKAGGGFSAE